MHEGIVKWNMTLVWQGEMFEERATGYLTKKCKTVLIAKTQHTNTYLLQFEVQMHGFTVDLD